MIPPGRICKRFTSDIPFIQEYVYTLAIRFGGAPIQQDRKRVTDIMAEIAAASNEQNAGIEQVSQSITQMDEVTQQNAALVEEAAAAAEAMQEQAHDLYGAVGTFKVVGGREAALRYAAKVAALRANRTAVAQLAETPVPGVKVRQLAKTKEKNGGDWKEF